MFSVFGFAKGEQSEDDQRNEKEHVKEQSEIARFGKHTQVFIVWLGEIHVPHIGAVESFKARIGEMDLPVADTATCNRMFVNIVVGLVPQESTFHQRGSA